MKGIGSFWRFLAGFARLLGRAWLQFRKDHCLVRASGLAFTSSIALVPFSALVFSILSLFGVFEPLIGKAQEFFFTVLVPTKQQVVMEFLGRFVENAKAVGYVGLFFFVFVAVFLINNIVVNVNAVWGTHYTGRALSRFSAYTVLPLVIALILGVSVFLVGAVQPYLSRIRFDNAGFLSGALLRLTPDFIVFLTLFSLFFFAPFARVKVRSALVGAVAGVIFWEISKLIFVFAINSVIRMSVIYGSIAVLPIFMIWLYITWGVFFFALEICYVHQYGIHSWAGRPSLEMPPVGRLAAALRVFAFIAEAGEGGETPPDSGTIIRRFHAGESGIRNILRVLEANGFIRRAGGKRSGFVLAAPPSKILLTDLVRVLLGLPEDYAKTKPGGLEERLVRSFAAAGLSSFDGETVESLSAPPEEEEREK